MDLVQKNFYTEDDYYKTPEEKRVELIKGKIFNQAAPNRIHQEILSFLHNTITNYVNAQKGCCKVYPAPFAVKLFADDKTIVEPDISVICDPGKLTDQGCTGAPDWIIEITSPSNPENDYIRKLNLYTEAGVQEYWIIDPVEYRIVVYRLAEYEFKMNIYSFQDKINTQTFDSLSISLEKFK